MESIQERIQQSISVHESIHPIIVNLRLIQDDLAAAASATITGRTADGREIIIPQQRYNLAAVLQAKIESAALSRLDSIDKLRAPPALQVVGKPEDDRDAIIEMVKKQA